MSYKKILDFSLSRSLREVLTYLDYTPEEVAIVERYSKGTEPKGTYLSYHLLSTEALGGVEQSTYLMEDRKAYTKQTMLGLIQISFYGDRSGEVSSKFYSRIPSSKNIRDIFSKWGFSVMNKSPLRNNPQLRVNEWVDSSNFDTNIIFAYYYKEDSDWWELVTANGFEFSIAKQ